MLQLCLYQVALIYHELDLELVGLVGRSLLVEQLIYHELDLELVGLVGRILLVEQLIYQELDLELVGLVGRILLVEQLLLLDVEQFPLLVVDQLSNPIPLSNRDVVRSLVEVEVTCMLFHTRLLQSSI